MQRRVTLPMATMSMPLATTATTSPLLRAMMTTTTSNGDITDNDNKYAVGNDGVNKLLAEGNDEYDTFSAPPACKHALRVSAQACPHAEIIILSAGGAESMILSACAESMILSALPAESMILSQCCPHMSVP